MLMKHLFLDDFEKMKFFSETELGVPHLALYKCWFGLIILCKKKLYRWVQPQDCSSYLLVLVYR